MRISAPHYRQETAHTCLSACVRMALAYLGDEQSERKLALAFQTAPGWGAFPEHVETTLAGWGYHVLARTIDSPRGPIHLSFCGTNRFLRRAPQFRQIERVGQREQLLQEVRVVQDDNVALLQLAHEAIVRDASDCCTCDNVMLIGTGVPAYAVKHPGWHSGILRSAS